MSDILILIAVGGLAFVAGMVTAPVAFIMWLGWWVDNYDSEESRS